MTAGIVAALPGEARALARLRARGTAQLADGTRLALSGLGHERAAATAKKLVADGADCLISWGSAAALLPALAPGDLLLPETIVTGDEQRLNCDAALIEAFGARFDAGVRIRYGALAEASSVLANVAAKQVLHERTRAIAADMESAAIARVAAEAGISFMAIRAIADDATMILPPAARAAVDDDGALRPLAMLWALAGRPSAMHAQLRALKQLAVAFKAAQNTLERAAGHLIDIKKAA